MRQREAVAALSHLGVGEDNLIFLGYPDGYLWEIYNQYMQPSDIFTTPFGQSTTYGNSGLGRIDYHSYRFGIPATYNRVNILSDLPDMTNSYRPEHIFVTSQFDAHPDHSITHSFLLLALTAVLNSDPSYKPTIHSSFVWYGSNWPNPIDPGSRLLKIQEPI